MNLAEFRTAPPCRTVLYRNSSNPTEVLYSPIEQEAVFEGDIVLGLIADVENRYRAYILSALADFEDAFSPIEDVTAEIVTRARAISVKRPGENPTKLGRSITRWPNATIVFGIESGLPAIDRVREAIAHWQSRTAIRFKERTVERDFVTFRSGNGCSASVGRVGSQQFITLTDTCSTGNIIHEIGHTVGLWHEQSRSDRDGFVKVHWSNIHPDAMHNFSQHITDGDDVGHYDFGSIMHYPSWAFALDTNRPTITARNGQSIGQRSGLSESDIAAVDAIYRNLDD